MTKRHRAAARVRTLGVTAALAAACAHPGRLAARPGGGTVATAHEGFVRAADGVALYYRALGAGRDTAVVVHGGPGFGLESLAPDLAPLARDRVLIFYDQRGAGRSTLLTDSTRLTVDDHLSDLGAVVAHFRLAHPALIGHSWGAGLVVRYAAAHPAAVGPLVLLEPVVPRLVPYFAQFNEALIARAGPDDLRAFGEVSAPARLAADPLGSCRARTAILMRLWGGADSVRGRAKADLCGMSAEAYRAAQAHTVPGANASLRGADLRADAAAVATPVLLVWGQSDPTPAAAIGEWKATLRHVTVLPVAAGGHFAHAERADVVLPAVDAFLRHAGLP